MVNFAFLLISLATISFCHSQQLHVEYSSAKLPPAVLCSNLYYDGEDSFYMLAGCSTATTQVLKYSLATDSISQIGTISQSTTVVSMIPDADGNLLLFSSGNVHKYNIQNNTSVFVARLLWEIVGGPTLESSNSVFIFGGLWAVDQSKIMVFNMENSSVVESPSTFSVGLGMAGSVSVGGRHFLFPYNEEYHSKNMVWEFHPESHAVAPVGEKEVPNLMPFPSAVSTGDEAYIVTGFDPAQTSAPSQEGILHFIPGNNATIYIPVSNWPLKDGERYYYIPPQCGYVAKLNRIYCFAGYSQNFGGGDYRYHDDIFYMDI